MKFRKTHEPKEKQELKGASELKGVRDIKGIRGLKGAPNLKKARDIKSVRDTKSVRDIKGISNRSSGLGILQDTLKHEFEQNVGQLQEKLSTLSDTVRSNIQSGLSQASDQLQPKEDCPPQNKGITRGFSFKKRNGKKAGNKMRGSHQSRRHSLILYMIRLILKREAKKRTKKVRRKIDTTIKPLKKFKLGLPFSRSKLLSTSIGTAQDVLDKGTQEVSGGLKEAQEHVEHLPSTMQETLLSGIGVANKVLHKRSHHMDQDQDERAEEAESHEHDERHPGSLSRFASFRGIPAGLAKATRRIKVPSNQKKEEAPPAPEREVLAEKKNDSVLEFLKNSTIINVDMPLKTFAEKLQTFETDSSTAWGIIGDSGHLVLVWKS